MEFLGSLLRERQEALIEKSSLSEKLAAAEKKLKYADDQFDQKKYSKQVAALKNELAAIPDKIVLDDAKAKLMFAATTRFEIYYLWEKQRHYATRNSYGAESAQLDNAFSDVAAFVAKFCTPAVSAWIKAHSNRMSAVYYSKDGVVFGRKTPCSLPNGNMTAGVVINELPCSVYVQDTTGGTVEWGIGIPHINKPGFVSTNNKGELAWKAGIPDTTRLGFISGAKENEWVLAPGFKKDGNAAKWVPGVAHPTIKGLITGAAVCSWIPDSKHMWVDPKDPANLSVRKDCKVWENILQESQAKNRSRYRGR